MKTNAEKYGLPSRVEVLDVGPNHVGIVKLIKSRIIQKDAVKILEMVKQIRTVDPNLKVSLICTSNICSKSLALLDKEGVQVLVTEL